MITSFLILNTLINLKNNLQLFPVNCSCTFTYKRLANCIPHSSHSFHISPLFSFCCSTVMYFYMLPRNLFEFNCLKFSVGNLLTY